MSRPINESIELLDTSLDNIKTSLQAKLESGTFQCDIMKAVNLF